MNNDMTSENFIDEISNEFPLISQEINSNEVKDLIHSQLTVLKNFIVKLYQTSENENKISRCLGILEKYLKEGNYEISNAISVSFLEHMRMKDYQRYKDDFPLLFREWRALDDHAKRTVIDSDKFKRFMQENTGWDKPGSG